MIKTVFFSTPENFNFLNVLQQQVAMENSSNMNFNRTENERKEISQVLEMSREAAEKNHNIKNIIARVLTMGQISKRGSLYVKQ